MGYKIYTKTGDKGKTSLFGGKRVPKDHYRIEAYGTVDELNSFIGLLRDTIDNEEIKQELFRIQNRLFDLGSYLATPGKKITDPPPVPESFINQLESWIDTKDAKLPTLTNFILPGGHPCVSQAHICRTVCRRAERRVVSLSGEAEIHPLGVKFLNRLSDYFFQLGREIALINNAVEVLWKKDEG